MKDTTPIDIDSANMNMSDAMLIRLIREGRSELFEVLIGQHVPRIYGLTLRMTGNPADAEDLLQESCLIAFTKLDTFEGNSAFGTWFYKIALNATYMSFRKKKLRAEDGLDEYLPQVDSNGVLAGKVRPIRLNPEDRAMQQQISSILEEAIGRLPPDFRAVLIARDIEELTTRETADALDISQAAVKSRLHRARLALRERLEKASSNRGVVRKWLDILSGLGKG